MAFLVSYTTELLEIRADDPKFHVLFIPGNPGEFCFIFVRMCVVRIFFEVVVELILRRIIFFFNVGVVTFYKEFVESLYEVLGGHASVTGKTWLLLVHVNFLPLSCDL